MTSSIYRGTGIYQQGILHFVLVACLHRRRRVTISGNIYNKMSSHGNIYEDRARIKR